MSDGLWNSGLGRESTQQAELSRHRLLRINLSATLFPGDASGLGQQSPNASTEDMGPHFVLSAVTPDNSHCYGFEFCLFAVGPTSTFATAPFEVTIWALIGTSVIQNSVGSGLPVWAAMATATVGYNELFHSFDVNACAIRFQIEDSAEDQAASRSVIIALSEL